MKWKQREAKLAYDESDSITEKLCKIRGVSDVEETLNPTSKFLHDPYLLYNLREVSEIIINAIKNKHLIAISADVDADGCTSAALMYRYIKPLNDNVYITYHERKEGHGVENQLEYIEEGTDLIIILDSSSDSADACNQLQEKGVQVVIIDHHEIEDENPYAIIVNPQQKNCSYPNKSISGVGLTWKMIKAIDDEFFTLTTDDHLDLVAVGMVADVMTLADKENRYIISEGMERITTTGLRALLDVKGIKHDEVSTQTIGYTITPLINGVARLNNIKLALELLVEDDYLNCMDIVKEMDALNEERKKKQKELVEEISLQVDENDKVIIAISNKSSKGYNGLIAGDLVSKYHRPAIVLQNNDGIVSGSLRSYGSFKMKGFLKTIPQILYVKGHEAAAGVGFKYDDLDHIKIQINDRIKEINSEEVCVEYDLEFDDSDLTLELVREIEHFNRLTGHGFPTAKVKVNKIKTKSKNHRKVLGKNMDAVKVLCDDVELIKFRTTDAYASEVGKAIEMSAVGQPTINSYYNSYTRKMVVNKQLILDDYKLLS